MGLTSHSGRHAGLLSFYGIGYVTFHPATVIYMSEWDSNSFPQIFGHVLNFFRSYLFISKYEKHDEKPSSLGITSFQTNTLIIDTKSQGTSTGPSALAVITVCDFSVDVIWAAPMPATTSLQAFQPTTVLLKLHERRFGTWASSARATAAFRNTARSQNDGQTTGRMEKIMNIWKKSSAHPRQSLPKITEKADGARAPLQPTSATKSTTRPLLGLRLGSS